MKKGSWRRGIRETVEWETRLRTRQPWGLDPPEGTWERTRSMGWKYACGIALHSFTSSKAIRTARRSSPGPCHGFRGSRGLRGHLSDRDRGVAKKGFAEVFPFGLCKRPISCKAGCRCRRRSEGSLLIVGRLPPPLLRDQGVAKINGRWDGPTGSLCDCFRVDRE
jgi:hypothetical protein